MAERPREAIDTFSINVQRYSPNHENIAFSGHQGQYKRFVWKFQHKETL